MRKMTKTHWNAVKHLVKKSNQSFYDLIEQIEPSTKLNLYLAEYAFADRLARKKIVYLPDEKGQLNILGSAETTNEIGGDLNYGKNSMPLGILLQKNCEWFYEEEANQEQFPVAIQGEGTIFNQQIIFDTQTTVENNTLSISSGAKSIFMLPYIGSQSNHDRIKNTYKVSLPAPKDSSEHHAVFCEILNNYSSKNHWVCTVLYFSEAWIKHIKNDKKWLAVKHFLSENLRKRYASDLYNTFYNDLFLGTESINRHRPTPFLVDTAKYIFSITMGQGIGYQPATNNQLLPIQEIQKTYMEHYQLPYTPTIMVPGVLDDKNDCIYYSLQQPSTRINTFKVTMNNSTYRELVALKGILTSYKKSFLSEKSHCFDSELYHACKKTNLEYYHNKPSDLSDGIISSKHLIEKDQRFHFAARANSTFSADAKFLRGCIRILKV